VNNHRNGGNGWKGRAEKAEEELNDTRHANDGLRLKLAAHREELERLEQRLAIAVVEIERLRAEKTW
jgi:chromosome segregation ATPase